MNTKGFIFDMFSWVLLLFIFAVVFVSFAYFFSLIIPLDIFTGSDEAQEFLVQGEEGSHTLDSMISLLMLGLITASVISGLFIDVNPVFIIPSLIFLAVFILAGAMLSNVFDEFISTDVFDGVRPHFKVTRLIIGNLPFIITFAFVAWGFGLYGKQKLLYG